MNAIALVEAPGHVCQRYRIDPFRPLLEARGHRLHVEPLASQPAARLLQLLRAGRYDLVLIQRKLLSALELRTLQLGHARLVFDFDDAVFSRDSYAARGPYSRKRQTRFARMMRHADLVLAGNDFLLSRAIHAGAQTNSVLRVPTCVEPCAYPVARHRDDPRVPTRLVWIGSSSTLQGITDRRDLWDRLAREIPGLQFRLICDQFPDLGVMPVEPCPWSSDREAHDLAESDIGIAWIPDDLWSRGKCGLKVLQYMAAGLPVVANPVGMHTELVIPGRSGFLPQSDDDWIDAIRHLATRPDLRAVFGAVGRARVEAEFSVSAWASRWVDSLFGAATSDPPPQTSTQTMLQPPHNRHLQPRTTASVRKRTVAE